MIRPDSCPNRLGAVVLMGLLAGAAGPLASGCRRAEEAPSAGGDDAPAEGERASRMPEVPAEEEVDPAQADVLVTDTTVLAKYAKPLYEQQTNMPIGSLRGFCFVPAAGKVRLPAPGPVDLVKGPTAVRDPRPGEVRYYEQARLRVPLRLGTSNYAGRVGVSGAAIVFRGIKAGPRPPLRRAIFSVSTGVLRGYFGEHSGHFYGVQVGPVKDRVQFKNFDRFPCRIALTELASGRTLYEAELPGDKAQFRGHAFDRKIKPDQSPPIRQTGFYMARGRRHPWLKAYLVVTDNPYVTVSRAGYRRDGLFSLAAIPVGTWTVQVWHPDYEPEQSLFPVEIEENETAELAVRFKVPAFLESPPAAKK